MYLKRIEHLKSKVHYLKSCLTLIKYILLFEEYSRQSTESSKNILLFEDKLFIQRPATCPPVFEDPPVFENLPLFVDSPALFEDLLVFKDSAVFEYSRVFEDAGTLVFEDLPQSDGSSTRWSMVSLSLPQPFHL